MPGKVSINANNSIPSVSPIKAGEYELSSKFGNRVHPISKEKVFHSGLDFKAEKGTSVMATANGTVVSVGFNDVQGNNITVNHENGYQTFYYHLDSYVVNEDAIIKQGDLLGYVGNTGESVGDHLHYEIRMDGQYINPAKLIN
ncbi:MAG: M23 family metallopeptidase [Flavobacteriales bacterium]|nr:M23 family metallopeptidase [Flavobacteriales bacterium]